LSRPRTRRRYHHGDLEPLIRKEALALVEVGGVRSLTMREIARRLGVSHAAPYRHYADREALITVLAIEGLERLTDHISRALHLHRDDRRAAFLAAGRAYVRFALDEPAYFTLCFTKDIALDEPGLLDAKERAFSLLIDFIGDSQRAGAFVDGDAKTIATPIWALHHGLATLASQGAFDELSRAAFDRLVDAAHGAMLDGVLRRAR
jgi:AcrR family transcriptional regulator